MKWWRELDNVGKWIIKVFVGLLVIAILVTAYQLIF